MKEPNIRFQEFNDEWEVQSFGTYIKECNELTSDKEKYPLYSLTIEEGVVPKPERYEREHLITKKGDSYKIVPPNAFVYNPMNLRFGALKVNHEDFPVCVSGYYDVFFMGNKETLKFWENYLLADRMLNYYYSIATGSLIEKLRVHFSQFVNIKKPLPSLAEQKKMSSLFKSIDNVISAIESEVVLWEEKKKGVMQKIFSQEVRFKKEDGFDYPEWKSSTFKDIFEILKNNTLSRAELNYEEGYAQNIHYGDVLTKYPFVLDVKKDVIPYITDKDMAKKVESMSLKNGDVIISDTAEDETVGKATEITNLHDEILVSGLHTIPIRPNSIQFELGYLGYFINSNSYHNQLKPLMQGIKVTSISKGAIQDTTISYPCVEEQKKIVNCLLVIDETIRLKKQKLATWRTIKKGLLQQMFV